MGREALIENYAIHLSWGEVPYLLKRSRRRRTVGLKLDPENGLVVYCPFRYSMRRLEEILHRHSQWIRDKSRLADERRSTLPRVRWMPGASLPFRGGHYPFQVAFTGETRELRLEDGQLRLQLSPAAPPLLTEEALQEQMHLAYRAAAREIIEGSVARFQSQIGVQPSQIRIKGQKTRWGSCSARGILNFNWRLVLAPPWVLDYVVIHELCHLVHLNHSQRFWARVEVACPDFNKARDWLSEHGTALYAY